MTNLQTLLQDTNNHVPTITEEQLETALRASAITAKDIHHTFFDGYYCEAYVTDTNQFFVPISQFDIYEGLPCMSEQLWNTGSVIYIEAPFSGTLVETIRLKTFVDVYYQYKYPEIEDIEPQYLEVMNAFKSAFNVT